MCGRETSNCAPRDFCFGLQNIQPSNSPTLLSLLLAHLCDSPLAFLLFSKANKQERREKNFFCVFEAQVLIEVLLPRPPRLPLDESKSIETGCRSPFVFFPLFTASPYSLIFLFRECCPLSSLLFSSYSSFGQTFSLSIESRIFFF